MCNSTLLDAGAAVLDLKRALDYFGISSLNNHSHNHPDSNHNNAFDNGGPTLIPGVALGVLRAHDRLVISMKKQLD